MPYFRSEQVEVFPSTYRNRVQTGKLTSENNFVNIINAITDNVGEQGYVLSYENRTLKVVIHGYYFEVKDLDMTKNLWVGINVEQGGYSLVRYDTGSPENLDKADGSEFYGLMYNNSINGFKSSNDDNVYYRLQVSDELGNVINKIKFSVDSVNYSGDITLKEELDSKQYKLVAGNGIDTITNVRGLNKVGLKQEEQNKLDALDLAKGSTGKRIYFNNLGIVQESSENIGKVNSTIKTGTIASQGVYVLNGITKAGQTIYASTGNPEGGNPGDIWFKYVN